MHPRQQIVRAVQQAKTRWQHRGRRPVVVVHQMGRVGSKSIRQAIREHATELRSMHTHYLNPETIAGMQARFERRYQVARQPGLYHEHLDACWLARAIRRRQYGNWRIISLVRDPVARTISAFFRHLPLNHPELGFSFRNDPANVPALIEIFRSVGETEHEFTLRWFDREVRDVFGVDVFVRAYPTEGGGCVYDCEAGRVLVLRTEDLGSTGIGPLCRFLGMAPFALPHENRSSDLSYAATYSRFLAELRMTPAYLDRMYGSTLARHFYSDDELAGFRRRWRVG